MNWTPANIGTNCTEISTGRRWAVTDVFEKAGRTHVGLLSWGGGSRRSMSVEEFEKTFTNWRRPVAEEFPSGPTVSPPEDL